MDPLQQLVETLRVLARTNEPNRVALIEKAVNEYLNDKAGIARLSLERPSIILTGDYDMNDQARANSSGRRVLHKPVWDDVLLSALLFEVSRSSRM